MRCQEKSNIKYRKYEHFNKNKLEKKNLNKLFNCNKETFQIDEFEELFICTLNNQVPLKTRFSRADQANFVSKELTKPFALRFKLNNIYLTEESVEARLLRKKTKVCLSFPIKKPKKSIMRT